MEFILIVIAIVLASIKWRYTIRSYFYYGKAIYMDLHDDYQFVVISVIPPLLVICWLLSYYCYISILSSPFWVSIILLAVVAKWQRFIYRYKLYTFIVSALVLRYIYMYNSYTFRYYYRLFYRYLRYYCHDFYDNISRIRILSTKSKKSINLDPKTVLFACVILAIVIVKWHNKVLYFFESLRVRYNIGIIDRCLSKIEFSSLGRLRWLSSESEPISSKLIALSESPESRTPALVCKMMNIISDKRFEMRGLEEEHRLLEHHLREKKTLLEDVKNIYLNHQETSKNYFKRKDELANLDKQISEKGNLLKSMNHKISTKQATFDLVNKLKTECKTLEKNIYHRTNQLQLIDRKLLNDKDLLRLVNEEASSLRYFQKREFRRCPICHHGPFCHEGCLNIYDECNRCGYKNSRLDSWPLY